MANDIVIDCPHCAVRVTAKATAWVGNGEEQAFFLVECPSCRNALFGSSVVYRDEFNNCWISCDHIPRRSWALFRARDVMRSLIESFKGEQAT